MVEFVIFVELKFPSIVTISVKVGDANGVFKSTYALFVKCDVVVGVNVDVGKFVLYVFVPVQVFVPERMPVPA